MNRSLILNHIDHIQSLAWTMRCVGSTSVAEQPGNEPADSLHLLWQQIDDRIAAIRSTIGAPEYVDHHEA
jgi:hypothetical protein